MMDNDEDMMDNDEDMITSGGSYRDVIRVTLHACAQQLCPWDDGFV